MAALGDISRLEKFDPRKFPEYVVIYRLKFPWNGNEFIGCDLIAKNIENALEEAHKWIGDFAFKKKHPIDNYEIVEVFRRTMGGCSVVGGTCHMIWKL